jgi:hypothetical protein
MNEEFQEPAAAEEVPAAKTARKRPAVRKSAKPKPASDSESAAAAPAEAPAPVRESEPVSRAEEVSPRESAPDVIPFSVETAGGEPPGNPKKRRRRKKKHGQGQAQGGPSQDRPQQPQQTHHHPHAVSPPAEAPLPLPETTHGSAMHAAPRPKLDPEQVAQKAWKIFQSEVGEEGLALIDDHDAREISRRCFRLAEIFLEEAARRNR